MSKLLLVIVLLCASGCSINYTRIPLSKILSDQPQTVYVQVITEDDYLSDMARIVQETKKIEQVKDVKHVRSDDVDYMSFWIPVTIGANGKNTKTLSIYYDDTSNSGIGWVMNSAWAGQFPRHFMGSGILLELCNDTPKEFVSTYSHEAAFDGWPSNVVKARFSQGKCIESAVFMHFNTPLMQRDIGEGRQTEFRRFLLEAAKAK